MGRKMFSGVAGCCLGLLTPIFAGARVPPEPIDPVSWLSADDYPVEALRRELEGTLEVKLAVDAAGKVERCDVVSSSGTSLLDDAACKAFVARGRFKPARDEDGKAVAGAFERRVVWRIPRTLLRSYINLTRIVIAADRTVESCENRQSNNAYAGNPCERYGDIYPAGQLAKQFDAGILTMFDKQIVDDKEPEGLVFDPAQLSALSKKSQFWTVDGSGKVVDCKAYAANWTSVSCDGLSDAYEAADDGHTRQVASVTILAFRPKPSGAAPAPAAAPR